MRRWLSNGLSKNLSRFASAIQNVQRKNISEKTWRSVAKCAYRWRRKTLLKREEKNEMTFRRFDIEATGVYSPAISETFHEALLKSNISIYKYERIESIRIRKRFSPKTERKDPIEKENKSEWYQNFPQRRKRLPPRKPADVIFLDTQTREECEKGTTGGISKIENLKSKSMENPQMELNSVGEFNNSGLDSEHEEKIDVHISKKKAIQRARQRKLLTRPVQIKIELKYK